MRSPAFDDLLSLVFRGDIGRRDGALALARIAVLVFVAVLPFPHNAAWKNIALFGMLLAIVWLIQQRRVEIDMRSPITLALGGLLAVLCFTAAIGTDSLDSFSELRKHFLPGVFLLLLVPQVFSEDRLLRLLLIAIASAFLLRTGLAILELAHYLPDLDAARAEGRYIKGFALDAGFYIPVLIGLFFLGGGSRWLAIAGLAMIFVTMLLVQSRTPLLAAALSVACMLLLLRRWRALLFGTILGVSIAGYVVVREPEIGSHLASIFDAQTYRTAFDVKNYSKPEDGLTARVAIWMGVLEITQPRALQGYGFGWKKLGKTAIADGYVEKWKSSPENGLDSERAWYFALPTDKVNPHNLYLQIYFESGWLGLIAYTVTILVLLLQAFRLSWNARGNAGVVAALVLAYLIDHVILGLTNGLWLGLGPSFVLIALLESIRRQKSVV